MCLPWARNEFLQYRCFLGLPAFPGPNIYLRLYERLTSLWSVASGDSHRGGAAPAAAAAATAAVPTAISVGDQVQAETCEQLNTRKRWLHCPDRRSDLAHSRRLSPASPTERSFH